MRNKAHIKVKGGDLVLIDLGGYGLKIELAKDKSSYNVEYVRIATKRDGKIHIDSMPADMLIRAEGEEGIVQQADSVLISRHTLM